MKKIVFGLLCLFTVGVVGCATEGGDEPTASSGQEARRCRPSSCAAQGATCGTVSDGCGHTLQCGTCSTPDTCGGGGIPNECGVCTPTTCALAGANCGTIADGCGGTLECGTCSGTNTCGGSGIPNLCGSSGGCNGHVCTYNGYNRCCAAGAWCGVDGRCCTGCAPGCPC